MEDEAILALYWQRDEEALAATAAKYGGYCGSIARQILGDPGDAEECVNDTWLHAWNAIPPHRPPRLSLFLGKITRELAINRWNAGRARKRGGGEYALALEELREVVSARRGQPEEGVEAELLGRAISDFLRTQPPQTASIFVRRYYHLCPIRQIAAEFAISESKTKSILFRMRKKLHTYLEGEELL